MTSPPNIPPIDDNFLLEICEQAWITTVENALHTEYKGGYKLKRKRFFVFQNATGQGVYIFSVYDLIRWINTNRNRIK
jgi:hypothetical protein